MKNAREMLIEELVKLNHYKNLTADMNIICDIADFIISDRKRIVAPLVKFKKDMGDDDYDWKFRRLVPTDIIDETLKNSGVL